MDYTDVLTDISFYLQALTGFVAFFIGFFVFFACGHFLRR
jgi:hypothetical protein